MNKRFLPALLIAVSVSTFALAQNNEPSKKENKVKEESITIRKKGDKDEKMTIVIDGDKITINGKPMEDLKDGDIEILRNKGMNSLGAIMPKIRGRIAPMTGGGEFKMFSDGNNSNRAFLGVSSEKSDKGAKIVSVEKESAAEKIGLKKDDIITKVDDTKIESSEDLYDAIGKYKPEDKVTITYLRDGKTATASVTLGKSKSPDVRVFNFDSRNFNRDFNFDMPELKGLQDLRVMPRMNGMEFSMNRKPKLGMQIQDVEEGKGVKVLDVEENTPSAKAGLQKGDVITKVEGKDIASVDELKSTIKDIKEGDSINLSFTRNGSSQTTTIKFPKKLKVAEL